MEQSPWNQFNITPATSAYLTDTQQFHAINTNNGTVPPQLLTTQNAPMLIMSQSGMTTSPHHMSTVPNVSLSSAQQPLNSLNVLSQQLIGNVPHSQHSNMILGMNSQNQMFTTNQPLLSNYQNQMVPRQMMTNQQSVQSQMKHPNVVQNRAAMPLQPPPNLNVRNIPHQNVSNTQGSSKTNMLREHLFGDTQLRQPKNLLNPQQMQMQRPPPTNSSSGARNVQMQQNLSSVTPSQPAKKNTVTVSKSDESKSQLLQFLADLKECSNKSKYYVSGTVENTYIVQLLTFKNMCGEFLKRSNNTVLKDQIRKKLSTMKEGETIINAKVERSKFVQDVLECILSETNIWTPDPEPEKPKSCSPSPQSVVSQPNPPPNRFKVKKEPGTESCKSSCSTSQVMKPPVVTTRISTPPINLPNNLFPSSIDELIRMSEEAAEPFNSVSDGPNFSSIINEIDTSQEQCETKPQLLTRNPGRRSPVFRQHAPAVLQQEPIFHQQAPVNRQQAPVIRHQVPVRQQMPVLQQDVNKPCTVLNLIRNPINIPLNQQAVPRIITPMHPFVPIRLATVVAPTTAQPHILQLIPNQNQSSPTVSSTTAVNAQTQINKITPLKKAKRKDLVRPLSPNDMCRVELEDQEHISSCLIESKITDKKTKDIQKVKKEEVVCALSSDLKRDKVIDPKESSYYWCNFCVYQTDHKGKLVNHVITAHRFSCQFCRFQCYSRADVVEHTVNAHKEAATMSKDFRYCVLLPDYLKILEKIENHENDAFENECIQSLKTKKIRGVTENDDNYIESDWEEEILGDDDFLSDSHSELSDQASDSEEEQASRSPKQGKKRKIKQAFLNSSSEDDNEELPTKRTKTSALEELKKKRKEKETRKKSKAGRKQKDSRKKKEDNSDKDSSLKVRRRSRRNTKADFSKVFNPLNDIFGSDNESEVSDDTDNDKDFVPGSNSSPSGHKIKTKDNIKSFLNHLNDSISRNANNNADISNSNGTVPVVVLKSLDTPKSVSADTDAASSFPELRNQLSNKENSHAPPENAVDNPAIDGSSPNDPTHDKHTGDPNNDDTTCDVPTHDDIGDPSNNTDELATTLSSDSGSSTNESVVSSVSSTDKVTSPSTISGESETISSAPFVTTTSSTSTNSSSGSGIKGNKVTLVKHCIHCDFVCDDIQEIKTHSLEDHPSGFLGVWQSALNFVLYICPDKGCDFYASMSQDFCRHMGRCSYTQNEDVDKAVRDTTNYVQCIKDKRLMKSSDLETQRQALKQFLNKSEEWTVVKPVRMVANQNAASPSPSNSPSLVSSSKATDKDKPAKTYLDGDDIMDANTFYKCAFCSFKCMGNTLTVRGHSIKHHPEYPLYTINLRAVEEGHDSRFVLFCVGQDCKEIFTQSKEYFEHVESCEKVKKLKNDAQLLKTNKFVKSTMYKL